MSLTLGRQGGIAQPLRKRTVGQINIAHVYDGANHIWPTSVIHFSDFTSVQLRYIWGSCDVYVAINAQYHDYAKLFEEWFGGNIDNKVFESAITFWFKDVDFDGDKVWEYFHMNN